ncbi:MAG: hypothetical protein K0B11_18865 [Mariniphaga sp.]|nr:hypothetical protein [Mariniphaga sp.]
MLNFEKITIIILLFFLLGCKRDRDFLKIDQTTLSPVKKISRINDSIFLSLVTDMREYKGFIYLSDFKNNRIVCIDSVYNFSHIIGSPGHGPAELNFPNGCMITNNKIYVIDEGHKRINIYTTKGGHIGNIKGLVPFSSHFIVVDSVYYGSPMEPDNTPPIFKARINGKVLKRFGTNTRLINDINTNAPRKFFLEKWHDQIIAICESDPIIERYSFDGEFTDSFDFSEIKHFNSLFPYIKDKEKKDLKNIGIRGVTSIVFKSYLENNKLFLLLMGYDKSVDKPTCHHILMLKVGKEKITPIKMLELNNNSGNRSWYYSFCVIENRLIAYDAFSYEIHEFKIN